MTFMWEMSRRLALVCSSCFRLRRTTCGNAGRANAVRELSVRAHALAMTARLPPSHSQTSWGGILDRHGLHTWAQMLAYRRYEMPA